LSLHDAARPSASSEGMATAVVVSGLKTPPSVTRNGVPVTEGVTALRIDGDPAWAVPLTPHAAVSADGVLTARAAARAAFETTRSSARLDYESGEHYILTKPADGVWRFQRQWPSGVAWRAMTPEGITVTPDGRLAMISLQIDSGANRVEMYAPRYLHDCETGQAFDEKATALVIGGCSAKPSVWVNGRELGDTVAEVSVGGKACFVVPLYDVSLEDVTDGLDQRLNAAGAKLP
jgi:hypothetical protein